MNFLSLPKPSPDWRIAGVLGAGAVGSAVSCCVTGMVAGTMTDDCAACFAAAGAAAVAAAGA